MLSYSFLALVILKFTIFLFLPLAPLHFFLSSLFHIIALFTYHKLHYCLQKGKIRHINVLNGIDYGFSRFDTPFSKNFIQFFYNCF